MSAPAVDRDQIERFVSALFMHAGEDAMAWRDRHREAGFRKAAYPSAARAGRPLAA